MQILGLFNIALSDIENILNKESHTDNDKKQCQIILSSFQAVKDMFVTTQISGILKRIKHIKPKWLKYYKDEVLHQLERTSFYLFHEKYSINFDISEAKQYIYGEKETNHNNEFNHTNRISYI